MTSIYKITNQFELLEEAKDYISAMTNEAEELNVLLQQHIHNDLDRVQQELNIIGAAIKISGFSNIDGNITLIKSDEKAA